MYLPIGMHTTLIDFCRAALLFAREGILQDTVQVIVERFVQ